MKNFELFLLSSSVLFSTALFALQSETQNRLDKKYTTKTNTEYIFMQQVAGLSNEEQDKFIMGKSFYRTPWVEAPTATTARDGLGPLFNSNTCINCHPNNGIGSLYNENKIISRNYVTRVSIPSNGSKEHENMLQYSGFVQEPTYGAQISSNGVHGVKYEAMPMIRYKDIKITYPDGNSLTLKKPLHGVENQLKELGYGAMQKDVILSNRLAPALVGLGFLEQLTDEQILSNQDINDTNRDGISGKANIVYSPLHKDFRVGRYTKKASAASVMEQSGAAAHNDMSLTNPFYASENCTQKQVECLNAPKADNLRSGADFDLPLERLEAIAFYLKNLKIPNSLITQKEGEKLFETIGCTKCHMPTFKLSSGYEIKPFTDMLLHDMGANLGDGRSEFLATPNEWKTPALWGIGKYILTSSKEPELLHDGRAKSIEEAILWHGGEAQKSQNDFLNLSKKERNQLIQYIKEL
ncbi:MAG: di-heme oxidoredictase family protein [Sulfurimonas sp.]